VLRALSSHVFLLPGLSDFLDLQKLSVWHSRHWYRSGGKLIVEDIQ
jgi:hypothetical protein